MAASLFVVAATAAVFLAVASAIPIQHGWVNIGAHDGTQTLRLMVAIKQENTHLLADKLARVSDPRSAEYGTSLSAHGTNAVC